MQNRQRSIGVVVENGIDMCLNISALAMAYIFAVLFKVPDTVSFESPRTMMIMFLVVLLQSFVFQGLNLYRPVPFVHPAVILGKIFRANAVYYLIVEFLCVLAFDESREFMMVWMLISAVISTAILLFKKRMMIRFIALFRKKQYSLRKVIIVGDNTFTAAEFVREVAKNSECGMMVLGYVGDRINEDVGCDKLGSFKDLSAILDEYHPSDVVFAIDGYDKRRLIRLVNICDDKCIKVYFLPVIYGFFKSPRQIEPVGSLPVINIHSTPLDNRFNAFIKRVIDVLGSLALIILTAPLMLIAAVGVKISSPGPIFFRQERVGKMGKRFVMLKFRSMRVNVDSEKGWTKGNDPRKTRFGTFIRKTSIDELPQLFNVLLGTMSLVGPRPEVPHFVEYFRERIPLYMVKHYVKPGMTGLAQIRGLRGDTSVEDRIHADIEYIENWSLGMDISILLKTPFKAINKQEKYVGEESREEVASAPTDDNPEVLENASADTAEATVPSAISGDGDALVVTDSAVHCSDGKDGKCDTERDGDGFSTDCECARKGCDCASAGDTDTNPSNLCEAPSDSADTRGACEEKADACENNGVVSCECEAVEEGAVSCKARRVKLLYAASTMSHINNFHLEYIAALREEGYEVKVMARGDGADFNVPFEKKFFSASNTACRAEIRRILEEEKFDIILLNTSLAAFHIRMSLPKKDRPRVINMVHGYLFSRDVGFIKRKMLLACEKMLRSVTDSIITMNEWDRQIAEKHRLCRERVYFCRGMGATVKPVEVPREKLRAELSCQDKFVMAFVGELSRRKNQEFLIYALNEIKEHIPNAVLWLIGDGLAREELSALANKVDVSESVLFLGRRENACDYMRACDLYVSASSIEGMPFNLIEAMGCGCSVLASRVKGHADLIEDGVSGLLYRFDDLDGFTDRVLKFHRGELPLDRERIAEAYSNFAKENVFDETLEIIKESFKVNK